MNYHVWTIGCQMNVAESQRLSAALEGMGFTHSRDVRQADIVVLNTCVVRQSAEDKATGFLWSLKPRKEHNPDMVIGLMGCYVGINGGANLREVFPHVDVFMAPGRYEPLLNFLADRQARDFEQRDLLDRYAVQDYAPLLPVRQRGNLVSVHVPVMDGCNHVCSYCVIPHRRGREHSRPLAQVVEEVRSLAADGVKEVTLLGQIVDRYGLDLPGDDRLPELLQAVHQVEGIERIRFLTSHPNYFDVPLIETMAALPKVCEHVELPIQSGDDEVLRAMKRGYSVDDYRRIIENVRARIPGASIATDVIVGFPGETEAQFQATLDLLSELKLDVCHSAMYSPRPRTLSAKTMADDVPPAEKKRRLEVLNRLQEAIVAEINSRLLGQRVEILVEEKHRGRWKGRTRTNKLVFFEDDSPPPALGARGWQGESVTVTITWTGPWSMQGSL
jgi:tRNA-2-methylthio-N6-dimethylallyladenosine synthase